MAWQEALGQYLAERLPSADSVEIAGAGYIAAGASNETLAIDARVRCGGRDHTIPLVLRPQRPDGILAPYDVERQFRVMRALAPSEVPVPAVAWYEASTEVLGSPFYLMTREQGETLPLFWYGSASPRLPAVAEMLATIHGVDWQTRGLAFLLPLEGASTPLASDLAPWRRMAEHAGIEHHRVLIGLGDYLIRNEPADARMALIHGDPNPGNYLMRGHQVAAVLDWEVAAIGDPRSDLGFYAALLAVFGGMPGRAGRTLLSDAYEAAVGRTLESLEFYEAVGLYKMAIVMSRWGGRTGMAYGIDVIARRLDSLLGPAWVA
jgi:aminoglycoside phosphotransferase (APT) family kinase protein